MLMANLTKTGMESGDNEQPFLGLLGGISISWLFLHLY
jgi:hypothetical protein